MFDFYSSFLQQNMNAEPSSARRITECGLQAALLVIMELVGQYVPIFGVCALMCYPLPILVVALRYGFKESVMTGAIATLLISMFIHPWVAFRIFLLCVPIGCFIGFGIKKGWPYTKIVCIASCFSMVMLGAFIALSSYFTGTLTELQFVLQEIPDFATVDASSPEMMQHSVTQFIVMVWPTVLFIASLMMIFPSIIISHKLFSNAGIPFPEIPSFRNLRIPVEFSYAFLLSILGIYLGVSLQYPRLVQFSMNVNLISCIFGAAEGAFIFLYVAHRLHWPRFVVFGIALLIMFVGIFGVAIMFIGICDAFVNFRKRYFPDSDRSSSEK